MLKAHLLNRHQFLINLIFKDRNMIFKPYKRLIVRERGKPAFLKKNGPKTGKKR